MLFLGVDSRLIKVFPPWRLRISSFFQIEAKVYLDFVLKLTRKFYKQTSMSELEAKIEEIKPELVTDAPEVAISDDKVIPDALDKEEYAYLRNQGFSSEAFKIEVRNLPKFYGYGEIKKLFNNTLKLDCHKIKIPKKNSPYGFVCFKNDEGENLYLILRI